MAQSMNSRTIPVTPEEVEAWRALDKRLNQPAAPAPGNIQAEKYTPFRPDPHTQDVQLRRQARPGGRFVR